MESIVVVLLGRMTRDCYIPVTIGPRGPHILFIRSMWTDVSCYSQWIFIICDSH